MPNHSQVAAPADEYATLKFMAVREIREVHDGTFDIVHGDANSAPLDPGRLTIYAALGAAAGAIPVPWVPDMFARRIRAILVSDIATHHGLSLTADARDILALPTPVGSPTGPVRYAYSFLRYRVLRRIGPLATLASAQLAASTFALGHLMHHYIVKCRTANTMRIDATEARKLRDAIDRSMRLAMSEGESFSSSDQEPLSVYRASSDESIDHFIIKAAGVPSWMLRRLDAAFERLIHLT